MKSILFVSLAVLTSAINVGPSVLLVPGLFGTRLKASGPRTSFGKDCPESYTVTQLDNTFEATVWLDWSLAVKAGFNSPYMKCWEEMLKIRLRRVNGLLNFDTYLDNFKVEVASSQSDKFHPEPIEVLAPSWNILDTFVNPSTYFKPIAQALRDVKYETGFDGDLFAMPYDWRLSPLEFDFVPIKEEIERRVKKFGKKVFLISHSMGCYYSLWFLNAYVDRDWKDSHIAGWMSITGALAGSGKALKAVTNSATIVSYIFDDDKLRGFNDASSAVAHLAASMANEYADLLNIELEGSTPGDTMTISARYFNQIFPKNLNRRALSDRVVELDTSFMLKDPEVPVFCISSKTDARKKSTVQSFRIKRDKSTSELDLQQDADVLSYTDGDGTVPLWSQELCRRWESTVFAYRYSPVDRFDGEHMNAVSSNNINNSFIKRLIPSIERVAGGVFVSNDPKIIEAIKIDPKTGNRPEAYFDALGQMRNNALNVFMYAYPTEPKKDSQGDYIFINYDVPDCGTSRLPTVPYGDMLCPVIDHEFDWTFVKYPDSVDTDVDFIRALKSTQNDAFADDSDNVVNTMFSLGSDDKLDNWTEAVYVSTEDILAGKERSIIKQHRRRLREERRKLKQMESGKNSAGEEELNEDSEEKEDVVIRGRLSLSQIRKARRLLGLKETPEIQAEEREREVNRLIMSSMMKHSKLFNTDSDNTVVLKENTKIADCSTVDDCFKLTTADMARVASFSPTLYISRIQEIIKDVNPINLYGDHGIVQMNTGLDEQIYNGVTREHKGLNLHRNDLVPPVPFKPLHLFAKYPPKIPVEQVYGHCGVRCDHGLFLLSRAYNSLVADLVNPHDAPKNGDEMSDARKKNRAWEKKDDRMDDADF